MRREHTSLQQLWRQKDACALEDVSSSMSLHVIEQGYYDAGRAKRHRMELRSSGRTCIWAAWQQPTSQAEPPVYSCE